MSPAEPATVRPSRTLAEVLADTTVLVPAAGSVPAGLVALSNVNSPAMIPVGGRPVIYWTMRYLTELGCRRFIIAVARRDPFMEDFVRCSYGAACDVQFIVPSRDGGLGFTVLELLSATQTTRALVVLGDTHFELDDADVLLDDTPTVCVHPVDDSYRWCVARVSSDGSVEALLDKEPGLERPVQALIGVYHLPNVPLALEAAAAAASVSDRSVQMSAVLERLKAKSGLRAVDTQKWLDVGNPDRQAAAHKSLLQARAFNELHFDPILGTVTKRSTHVAKFLDEIDYYRLLPAPVAVLFPRLIDYCADPASPSVQLEYYGYPSLSEAFVFENADPSIWEEVFRHLLLIITGSFMEFHRPLGATAVRSMYFEKTRERAYGELPAELVALRDSDEPLRVNGTATPALRDLWPIIERRVDKLAANARGTVIHGDLCLSNVLYDLRSRICKFIDPRGRFGDAGVYGDVRYDVAKLYHSVLGGYDFLVNDLFDIEVDGRDVRLDIRTRPYHRELLERFERVFFGPFDRSEVLFITSMLFLSMPALHYDHPRRQLAMFARGMELLGESMKDEWD